MKYLRLSLVVLSFSAILFSCGEKSSTKEIIAKKPVAKKPAGPASMQNSNSQMDAQWLDKTYQIQIDRHANTSLAIVEDEGGNSYYDNEITVKVIRPDGTTFYDKTFTKSDFSSIVPADYLEKSALVGIVFDKVEGDALQFAVSVGSPDALSDEYMPLLITLSRMGNISISKDSRLDNDNMDE